MKSRNDDTCLQFTDERRTRIRRLNDDLRKGRGKGEMFVTPGVIDLANGALQDRWCVTLTITLAYILATGCTTVWMPLNSATCDNHHGDDADVMPKKGVDSDVLKVFVTDALELVGARRPAEATSTAVAGGVAAVRPSPSITIA